MSERPVPPGCPYALAQVALGSAPGGVWVDAVLTCDGEPVARIVQHGDGGPDHIRPLAPAGWADVREYEQYARAWGAQHGIRHEPADALTAELLAAWAATQR
ncbi:hypothetical protein ACT17Q_00605 [Cellulomonas sp. CW35]|uniref:hypothetical protein n=1 Tax=Cellulomonas sp. CW35 TaxID=3458249 RepID=UPI004034E6F8